MNRERIRYSVGRAGAVLRDDDLRDLANFVSKGQVKMDQYIDRATKRLKVGDDAAWPNEDREINPCERDWLPACY